MQIHSVRTHGAGLIACLLVAACAPSEEMERVEPQNVSMQNSPILERIPDGASTAAASEKFCLWNDKKYTDGASVCDSRIRYKCWGDKWVEVGQCKS